MALQEYPPHIKAQVGLLPDTPGVYQFFDEKGKILYVGKARNLKKRVSSYFSKNHDTAKTKVLVSKIADIRPIITSSEYDALLLENNLIKEYLPRYNINLKDDKTYPWVRVSNEPFPRVFYTRNRVNDGSVYFGPFASVRVVKTLTELARHLFKPRSCRLPLEPDAIRNRKFKACLELQIGNCLGPCIGLQSIEDYQNNISQLREILKGHIAPVMDSLRKRMIDHAERCEFEKAQELKEKLALLESYSSRSQVVHPTISNLDVFSLIDAGKELFMNYFRVVSGSIVQSVNHEFKRKMDETTEEILALAIFDFRNRFGSESSEILVPFPVEIPLAGVKISVPRIGDKKKLMDLSLRNARSFQFEMESQRISLGQKKGSDRVLETLKKDLYLKDLPVHIECFDNSNLQGTNPVAACVVFKNGKPSKSDYRHFNIKSVIGPNDFASMEEVLERRYKRLIDENHSLPQLVVIDGGKGQLGAARSALDRLGLQGRIALIGIAKRLEEIYFPDDPVPKYLDKRSESLKLIQNIRNEAHRFGISFHRSKRSRQFLQSELNDINGIGEKTIQLLIARAGSVENAKLLPIPELEKIIGKKKTALITAFFRENPSDQGI